MSYVQATYLPGDTFYFTNGETYIVLHVARDPVRTLTTIDERGRLAQFPSSVFEVHMKRSNHPKSTTMSFFIRC